ncbi:CRISPR-associated protein Cas4 [Extensimonas sp. H3M7-6]|uniref:CRISPR-associated protein Cas4 n=1 Tax=Extensimonas soli TaxID=3031322 RepID=UPI0023D9B1F5|nr:CRISPR-associated protein Cas4 [Extensimonas sp. H3M7-6]MDF1481836.1 CRISPR-associated protein Cas4 [Extensimonas sp. H3M7-6]
MREDDYSIPISALQHWCYCPRQCGLIHLEQSFADNVHTARGQALHHLVDTPGYEMQAGVKVERALPLWSDRLGLIGKADLVEFHPDGRIFPVEFKHGPKRAKRHDDVQLAAQALCLEEMLARPVTHGAIYHASSRRRREVEITPALRALVVETAEAIRAMLASGRLPPPANDARCRECSLIEICQPAALAARSVQNALRAELFDTSVQE